MREACAYYNCSLRRRSPVDRRLLENGDIISVAFSGFNLEKPMAH